MNKKIGIVVAVIVLVLLAGYFAMNRQKTASVKDTKGETPKEETTVKSSTEQQSLKGLLSNYTDKMCTFNDGQQGSVYSGTVYVGNGKMRGEFTVTVNNQTTKSSMISDGKTGYMWTDGQNMGYKMDLSVASQESIEKAQKQAIDQNKNYNFSCSNWNVDESKFNLPSGIEFKDLSSLMTPPAGTPSVPAGSADVKANMKAACNSLQEPAKTQCLNALK